MIYFSLTSDNRINYVIINVQMSDDIKQNQNLFLSFPHVTIKLS